MDIVRSSEKVSLVIVSFFKNIDKNGENGSTSKIRTSLGFSMFGNTGLNISHLYSNIGLDIGYLFGNTSPNKRIS